LQRGYDLAELAIEQIPEESVRCGPAWRMLSLEECRLRLLAIRIRLAERPSGGRRGGGTARNRSRKTVLNVMAYSTAAADGMVAQTRLEIWKMTSMTLALRPWPSLVYRPGSQTTATEGKGEKSKPKVNAMQHLGSTRLVCGFLWRRCGRTKPKPTAPG
jgi:hypothetical protein